MSASSFNSTTKYTSPEPSFSLYSKCDTLTGRLIGVPVTIYLNLSPLLHHFSILLTYPYGSCPFTSINPYVADALGKKPLSEIESGSEPLNIFTVPRFIIFSPDISAFIFFPTSAGHTGKRKLSPLAFRYTSIDILYTPCYCYIHLLD